MDYYTSAADMNLAFNIYSNDLIHGLNDTAHMFPNLLSVVERIGPGIDPRTADLGNVTLNALAFTMSRLQSSCNPHERYFDRFITDSSSIRVYRYRYAQEIQLIRTVIETTKLDAFVRSSTDGDKITLLTQITADRTYMLDILLSRWEGPIIAVIYVSQALITPKHRQLCNWLNNLERPDVKIILVQKVGLLYPVNWLRNIAIQRAHSKYIFVSDGDFVPSVNLHGRLLSHLGDLERNGETKTVLLVPAFEMLINDMEIPESRDDIIQQLNIGLVDGFHRGAFEIAHNSTNYKKWMKAKEPYMLPRETPCNDHFEPYLIMERARSPYFPETLLERRKNKIAYQYELCTNGFDYKVIDDGFLVHKHHPESMRALTKVEACVEVAWDVFKQYVQTHPMRL